VFTPQCKIRFWAGAAGASALVLGSVGGLASGASAAEVTRAATTATPAQTGSSISTAQASVAPFVAKRAVKKASTPTTNSATGKYSYFDSDFILRLRGSAIQPEADIPKPLTPGIGYSAVNLEKDIGGELADCEIFGAGMYLTDIVQEGILENSGPPDAGNKGGGIFNPTESKDTKPNLSPGENLNTRKPGVRDVTDGHRIMDIPHEGNGVHWKAECTGDNGGKAVGNNLDVAGVYGVGSTTTGNVDKTSGEYLGNSRAYVAGLGPAGMDVVQSFAAIKHLPGQKPVLGYRIGVNGTTTAAGSNIPYGDLTKSFNDAVKGQSSALSAIGPSQGLIQLMGPTESQSENGGRYIINFPFFELQQGIEARKGTAGHNQRLRLVNIDYEGLYKGGALQEPKGGGFDS
jgi:hypothetical protein